MPDYTDAINTVVNLHQDAGTSLALDKSPDEAARAFELSSTTGVPAEHIANDIDGFEAQHKQALGQSIIDNNAHILDFINSHPLHGQLVNDDLGNLDKFSRSFRSMVDSDRMRQGFRAFSEANEASVNNDSDAFERAAFRMSRAVSHPDAPTGSMKMAEGVTTALLWGSTIGLAQAAKKLYEDAISGKLHQELSEGAISPDTAATAFGLAGAVTAGLRVGRPVGLELHEGEILPPEAGRGLPQPEGPPTIEGEAVDLGRRQFLQGAGAAAASALIKAPALEGALKTAFPEASRLTDLATPQAFARQYIYMFGDNEQMALEHLLDLAKDSTNPNFARTYLNAAKMIQSGFIKSLPSISQMAIEQSRSLEDAFRTLNRGVQDLRPWAEAGEVPPEGVSEIVDQGRAEVAKIEQDQIKEVLDDAKATNLKERSPEKFSEFMDSHSSGTVSIDKAGIEAKPEAFKWIDSARLQSPLSTVEIPAKDFVANFDPELWPEVKDFISKSGMSVEAAKELKPPTPANMNLTPTEQFIEEYDALVRKRGAELAREGFQVVEGGKPPEEEEPLEREVLQRGRSGRPIRTEPLPPTDPLVKRIRRAAGLDQELISSVEGEILPPEPEVDLEQKPWIKPPSGGYIQRITEGQGSLPTAEELGESLKQLKGADFNLLLKAGLSEADAKRLQRLNRIIDAGGTTADDAIKEKNTILRKLPEEVENSLDEPDLEDEGSLLQLYLEFENLERQGGETKETFADGMARTLKRYIFQFKDRDPFAVAVFRKAALEAQTHGINTEELTNDVLRRVIGDLSPGDQEYLRGMFEQKPPPTSEPPQGLPPPEEPREKPPSGEIFERAKAYGRTEAEYAKIQKLMAEQDAADVAYAAKRAERQAALENSKEWKAEDAKIRGDIENEVRSRPEVAAYQFLAKGEYMGQKVTRRLKLDRQFLSKEQADAIPAFVSDSGVHPDGIANLFGFPDGNSLVDSLVSVERATVEGRGDVVKRLTDAEVNRQLQERLGPSAAERLDEARDQALSTTTMELLAERTMALGQRAGAELPLSKADMDRGASRFLAEERFGSITTDRLLSEAARASRKVEQAMTKGDWMEAFRQQQVHYALSAMAKESKDIAKEARAFNRAADRYWKRFTPDNPPPVPSEYVNWIQDILLRTVSNRVPMRSEQDLAEAIGREDIQFLQDFVIDKQYYGRDIPVPDFLLDPSYRKPLKDMTVAEARQTMLAVRQLAKNGREEKKVNWNGEKRDKKEVMDSIVKQIADSVGQQIAKRQEGLAAYAKAFNSQLLQVPTMFNRMDLGDAFGPLQKNLLRPAMDAQGAETKLDRAAAKIIEAIKYKGDLRQSIPNSLFRNAHQAWNGERFDWLKADPLPFTRGDLLGVMHNMGNIDNFERMLEGHGLEDKAQQVVDWVNNHATPEDWRYVTELGHRLFNETLRGPRNEMYNRLYGATPKDIEMAIPDTPNGQILSRALGQIPGWYHPIIHDPAFPGKIRAKGDTLFPDEYFFAGTPNGYTKERTGYRGPLSFKLSLLASRIKQEIHDITWREAVTNINSIVNDPRFQNTVTKHYGSAWASEISDYPKRLANIGTINDTNWMLVEHALDFLRQNIVGSVINFNPHTVQKHGSTAFANSIINSGVRPDVFAQAAKDLFTGAEENGEKLREMMYRESNEIPRRHQNWMEMAAGQYLSQAEAAFGGKYMKLRQTLNYIGSSPVAVADLVTAEPLWLGAYRTGRAEMNLNHGDAVYFADRIVSRAHGSTSIVFTPGIMVGGQGKQWVASIYRFANHILNRQYENAWQMGSKAGYLGPAAKASAGSVAAIAAGFFVYYIYSGLIDEWVTPSEGKLPGVEKGTWTDTMAKSLIAGTTMGIPVARDVAKAIVNDGDPSLGITSIPVKDINDLVRDLKNHEFGMDPAHGGKTLQHLITVFGAFSGLTNAQEGKGARYLWDWYHDRDIPQDLSDLYRGATKGQQRPPSGPDLFERLIVNLGGGRYRQRKIKR